MKTLLACLLLLASAASAADVEFKYSRGVIRLSDQACSDAKVVKLIKPEFLAYFRAGYITFDGQRLALCWAPDPQDRTSLFVIDETGDRGPIPMSVFKPVGARI